MECYAIREIILIIFAIQLFNVASAQFSADEKLNILSENGVAVLQVGERRALFCVSHEPGLEWVDLKGKVVGPRGPQHHVHVEEVAGQLILIFDDPRLSDNGTWTCRAGNMERTIDVFVFDAAQFEPRKLLETPLEDEDQTLTCTAKGVPPPKLSWYRNGVLMTGKLLKVQLEGVDQTLLCTAKGVTPPTLSCYKNALYNPAKYDVWEGKLVVRHVRLEDSGDYECRAQQNSSVWNNTASSITKVLVRHSPIMKLVGVQTIYVLYDHIRIIRCSATAYPKPSYRWSHLTHRSERFIPSYGGDIYTSWNGSFSELTIRVNGWDDLGDYICYAKNPLGENKTVFNLVKGTKPDPPTKVACEKTTSDAVLCQVECSTCSQPKNETAKTTPDIGYRFELMQQEKVGKYVEREPVYWEEEREEVVKVDVERPQEGLTRVPGLRRNTTYALRVATLNMAGPSDFIECEKQFTTKAGAATVQPLLRTGAATALAVLMTWALAFGR